ncbi:AzlC family ABC transporter permease [Halobacillus aidingensis]|uniref:4-azaleucine resistance probable transporter AzlC n=1 Tax=Halobacillus aidingensis TaxID=240303 RepID=A0A1H0G253_HALAD|nr:AzlC family ABC transporter permease [Halobacillus aidingensis]SDO00911.1 4-azaleucine resistance probable transporter AzlC [Halobacillus aidingensis]
MKRKELLYLAFKAAFPKTIPILTGFMFVGAAYGIFMQSLGFHPLYATLMSLLIFAGSMEFVAGHLLLVAFNPINAAFLTLILNSRHLFYGVSLLDKYNATGAKKYYLIFGMCDESFAINSTARIPKHIDKGWFMFFVTLLNHIYWVLGATIGGLFGAYITFNTEGLEFVMTALFTVIFLDQWLQEENHQSSIVGIGGSLLCLVLLGPDHFILPSLVVILSTLILMKKSPEKREVLEQ